MVKLLKVNYDFNRFLKHGYDKPVPLSKTDFIVDTDGNEAALSEGMAVRIVEIDYDVFDRRDDLCADGVAVYTPDDGDGFKWWFNVNTLGVRHESDDPNFKLPELSEDGKRGIICSKIEEQVSKIRTGNAKGRTDIAYGQIEYYVKVLRGIDSGEV